MHIEYVSCVRYNSDESVRDYAIRVFSMANQERQHLTTHNINTSETYKS